MPAQSFMHSYFADHPFWTVVFGIAAPAIVAATVVDLFRLRSAARYIHTFDDVLLKLRSGNATSVGQRGDPGRHANPLARTFYVYVGAFQRALEAKTLPSFSVENSLGNARRAASTASRWRRPLAGWLLLSGLIVTLVNLQSSVGSLGQGLRNFGVNVDRQPTATSSSKPIGSSQIANGAQHGSTVISPRDTLQERADNVRLGMVGVAESASSAFGIGLGFIFLALLSMICASILEFSAHDVLNAIQHWAEEAYQALLPHQSAGLDKAANELALAAANLKEVSQRLSTVATQVSGLSDLVQAMTSSSDTIKQALDRLPDDLKNSMSNISDELVQGMTRSLDETNEGVKKVLEIYGTQQLNMDKVRQHMESVAESSKRMAASVDRLGTLPEDVRRLQASIETNVQAQDRLGAVVDRTNTAIQNLPVNELRQALEQEVKTQVNLVETATGIRNTMKQLQAAISQHAEIEPKLVQAVLEANHRVTEIARVLESFQTTSAMGVKGAYLLPIAEDTLRKLREIESSSDIGEVHRSVALLRKQIQVAKDQALAQAAAVTGGIQ